MFHIFVEVLTRLGSGIPDITASINKLKYDTWDPYQDQGYRETLQIWMDLDKVLRDRIDDIEQRISTLETNYTDLILCVIKQINYQNIPIERVKMEVVYLRNKEQIQNYKITSRLAIQQSQIEALDEKSSRNSQAS
ncbi:hypothetical protein CHS0354_017073 [Potamilus streckersoni]|uniref:Uncharacterized protein n=1 Tax=Potamilus streckersoni TaxID=2493646 RepID=A0AAE0S6Y6_9BIVA|nr:hypothetical protein CHS0354_017073 [Potamilus streckersoni]